MVNVGIVGATGYAGEILIDILLKHPNVRITDISAKIDKPQSISGIFPRFKNKIDLICAEPNIKELIKKCDAIFLALPHTVSMEIAPELLKAGKVVIDLSADYRFKDVKVYEQFYKTQHKDKARLDKAIYGLPELYRQKIKASKFIANPGCYPTAAILGLAPLLATNAIDPDSIIIDAKSGTSGAGRKLAQELLFSEVNEDFKAYKVNVHQHAPEIDQELSKVAGKKIKITFVPHLLPLNRGILETIYVKKSHPLARAGKAQGYKLVSLYKKFYKNEPFVRIKEEGFFPQVKDVSGTNFCDIGIKEDADTIIVISVIDNLIKGAAGQAVQNFNIIYKFPESTALR